MQEENHQATAARQRRVQKLKKIIVSTVILGMLVPLVLCVILLVQVSAQRKALKETENKIKQIMVEIQLQNQLIEELLQKNSVNVQGEASTAEALPETENTPVGIEEKEPEQNTEIPESTAAHRVYLTFDDGPSGYTDDILDVLDQYGVKATFFVVGKDGEHSDEALKEIVDRGHTIGMHSYSHKYSSLYSSVDAFAEDFQKIRGHIYDVTGVESNVYRFPGGSSNSVSRVDMHDLIAYLDSQDVRYFDWNVASGDGGKRKLSVNEVVQNSLNGITTRDETIILLHDSTDRKSTVEALPILIESILAMEDTEILPITDRTEPIQHVTNGE